MAPQPIRRNVALTMRANTTDISVHQDGPSERTADDLRRRRAARLRDAPAPQRDPRLRRRDDGSHTPPHGDAVLPRRTPAH
jgi:hypothetical protein